AANDLILHTGHTVALRNDGTVWEWGNNHAGQLGNGSTTDFNTPVQVLGPSRTGSLTGITAIAAGYEHTTALKNDSTVWDWGDNSFGRLGVGNGSLAQSNIPVQVVGPSGVGSLTGISAVA